MKLKSFIFILLACYLGSFLRIFIDNNLIISIIGSFFVGFIVNKKLSLSSEKLLLSGFFSCFTSFTGFIYFLYSIFSNGDWLKFIIFFNLIVIINLMTMYLCFWISRKIT